MRNDEEAEVEKKFLRRNFLRPFYSIRLKYQTSKVSGLKEKKNAVES